MQLQKGQGSRDHPYFRLIQAVGSSGKYQTAIIILSCFLSFQNGIISLGTPYYFAVAPYTNCPPQHEGIAKCSKFVCSLPEEEREQYLQPHIKQLRTLGTEFGDYHCEKAVLVESAKGMYYFGGLVGIVVTSVLADNIGRRLTLLLGLLLGVAGYSILFLARTLLVAEVGLFVVGLGVEPGFNMAICYLSEILENDRRQKMISFFQAFFCIAGLTIILLFYLFKDWKTVFLYFCFIPTIAGLIFCFYFVKDTPQFLIKRQSVSEIRDSLRFIAWVNDKMEGFEQNQVVGEKNIELLKRQYLEQTNKRNKKAFSYLDLFTYKSLRLISVCTMLLFFCVNILYYAPLMLIDQFGFNFYLNGVVINSSQLVTYVVGYFTVTLLRRKALNIATSIISLACSFALIFLSTNQICTDNCWNAKVVLGLVFVFIMRFFVSLQFQVMYAYLTQLYPIQVEGLALGLCTTIGGIPSIFIPSVINLLNNADFSVMILFCITACVLLAASLPLQQTFGSEPRQKIQEIQHREVNQNGMELVQQMS